MLLKIDYMSYAMFFGNCSDFQKILIHLTVLVVIALFHNTQPFCNNTIPYFVT